MLGYIWRRACARQRTMLNAGLSAVFVTAVGEVAVSLPPHETIEYCFIGLGSTTAVVCGGSLLLLRVQRILLERAVLRDAECLLRASASRRHLDGI